MIGGALGAAICSLLGATAEIPPVGGMYGFISISNGWAYLVGLIVGAVFIAVVSTMFVNFNVDTEEAEADVNIEDIEISFEQV